MKISYNKSYKISHILCSFSNIFPVDEKRESADTVQCYYGSDHEGTQRIIGYVYIEFCFLGYPLVHSSQCSSSTRKIQPFSEDIGRQFRRCSFQSLQNRVLYCGDRLIDTSGDFFI